MLMITRFRARVLASVLLAASVAPFAQADEALPPPQYSIKQSDSTTGTRIPRKIVQGSAIPLNRSYAQLTQDEQRLDVLSTSRDFHGGTLIHEDSYLKEPFQ